MTLMSGSASLWEKRGHPVADELDRYRLAYAVQVARSVIDADGVVQPDELDVFGQIFPAAMLRGAGLVGEDGAFTPLLDQLASAARDTLPEQLPLQERLDLVTLFYLPALSRGLAGPQEQQAVVRAGEELRIPADRLATHLEALGREPLGS